jgi:hypothetical protein
MVAGLDPLRAELAGMQIFALIFALAFVTGCGRREAAPVTRADTVTVRTVVDSILPVAEEVRRFKLQRGGIAAAELNGGAASRDELVKMFITAVEKRDSVTLAAIAMNAAEFIDLYYPTSQFARPPYKQSPELRWFLLSENSDKGVNRLLQRFSRANSRFQGYTCNDQPVIEGKNRIWDRCTVTWSHEPRTIRLFSTIIERGGRFKIVSYANGL